MSTDRDYPNYGDVREGFTMQPCGPDGRPVNHGQHYANANSLEDALSYAERVLAAGNMMGHRVTSVQIDGTMMEFVGTGWRHTRGTVSRRIRGTYGYPAEDANKVCREEWGLDAMRMQHPRRFDGSCPCGEFKPR
jgi:hypothetical protein